MGRNARLRMLADHQVESILSRTKFIQDYRRRWNVTNPFLRTPLYPLTRGCLPTNRDGSAAAFMENCRKRYFLYKQKKRGLLSSSTSQSNFADLAIHGYFGRKPLEALVVERELSGSERNQSDETGITGKSSEHFMEDLMYVQRLASSARDLSALNYSQNLLLWRELCNRIKLSKDLLPIEDLVSCLDSLRLVNHYDLELLEMLQIEFLDDIYLLSLEDLSKVADCYRFFNYQSPHLLFAICAEATKNLTSCFPSLFTQKISEYDFSLPMPCLPSTLHETAAVSASSASTSDSTSSSTSSSPSSASSEVYNHRNDGAFNATLLSSTLQDLTAESSLFNTLDYNPFDNRQPSPSSFLDNKVVELSPSSVDAKTAVKLPPTMWGVVSSQALDISSPPSTSTHNEISQKVVSAGRVGIESDTHKAISTFAHLTSIAEALVALKLTSGPSSSFIAHTIRFASQKLAEVDSMLPGFFVTVLRFASISSDHHASSLYNLDRRLISPHTHITGVSNEARGKGSEQLLNATEKMHYDASISLPSSRGLDKIAGAHTQKLTKPGAISSYSHSTQKNDGTAYSLEDADSFEKDSFLLSISSSAHYIMKYPVKFAFHGSISASTSSIPKHETPSGEKKASEISSFESKAPQNHRFPSSSKNPPLLCDASFSRLHKFLKLNQRHQINKGDVIYDLDTNLVCLLQMLGESAERFYVLKRSQSTNLLNTHTGSSSKSDFTSSSDGKSARIAMSREAKAFKTSSSSKLPDPAVKSSINVGKSLQVDSSSSSTVSSSSFDVESAQKVSPNNANSANLSYAPDDEFGKFSTFSSVEQPLKSFLPAENVHALKMRIDTHKDAGLTASMKKTAPISPSFAAIPPIWKLLHDLALVMVSHSSCLDSSDSSVSSLQCKRLAERSLKQVCELTLASSTLLLFFHAVRHCLVLPTQPMPVVYGDGKEYYFTASLMKPLEKLHTQCLSAMKVCLSEASVGRVKGSRDNGEVAGFRRNLMRLRSCAERRNDEYLSYGSSEPLSAQTVEASMRETSGVSYELLEDLHPFSSGAESGFGRDEIGMFGGEDDIFVHTQPAVAYPEGLKNEEALEKQQVKALKRRFARNFDVKLEEGKLMSSSLEQKQEGVAVSSSPAIYPLLGLISLGLKTSILLKRNCGGFKDKSLKEDVSEREFLAHQAIELDVNAAGDCKPEEISPILALMENFFLALEKSDISSFEAYEISIILELLKFYAVRSSLANSSRPLDSPASAPLLAREGKVNNLCEVLPNIFVEASKKISLFSQLELLRMKSAVESLIPCMTKVSVSNGLIANSLGFFVGCAAAFFWCYLI